MGGKDVFGLSVYLVDYFEAHVGDSMGSFYTDGAKLGSRESEKGEAYTIATTVWLPPFDLGVSQTVGFEAAPLGEHDIYTMSLMIDRLSGDAASWKRVNQNFMNSLRKQFLIWRTVTAEDKVRYAEKGRGLLEEAVA